MNYSGGKWVAYGYTRSRQILGYIDRDEFFRDGAGVPIFRVEGLDLYDMNGRYRGSIDYFGAASDPVGSRLFTLEPG